MRSRTALLVAGAAIVIAACGGSDSGSSAEDPAVDATVAPTVAPTDAPATTTDTAPATTAAPADTPPPTTEPADTATTSALLLPGEVLGAGQTAELPYLALDAAITLTGTDTDYGSYAEFTGVGWATLFAQDDSDGELTLANALAVSTVSDPAWNGDASTGDPRVLVDDQVLEWFAAQPAVVEAAISDLGPEFEGTGITGRRLDYVIGDVSGIGAPCFVLAAPADFDTGEICASLLAFGPYLRSFWSGEEGTVFDLTIGTTRLVAVAIGDGAELATTLASIPRSLPADTVGAALVGDGSIPEGTTYAVPGLVDGHDVRVTATAAGLGVLLDPGTLRITSPDQGQPVLSVLRGDVSYWNPDPTYAVEFPVDDESRLAHPVAATFDADDLTAVLPPSVTIVEPPSPITISGFTGTQVVLQHTGAGLDLCPVACVNGMLQTTGRGAFLQDGVPRRFAVVDVDGQPTIFVATGPVGDAMLLLVTIDPEG